ncbi:TPA: DUF551 domain-containing protein [Enterobacter roggenkampii]|nr:DUF551 domain-containing protein [Enterobacter roggenkampii]
MSTITKERAELKAFITGFLSDPMHDDKSSSSLTAEVFRIALASLEAVPVGTFKKGPCGYHPSFHEDAVPLYTAPPAPVYVPAAMEMDDDFDSSFEHGKAVGWNACRAAILQGAEPVQGWIPCSDRMPTKNDRVLIFINFNSDTVPPSIHDAQFTGSTFRRGNATVNVFPLEDGYGVTHWMPMPATPQQEADNG